MTLEYRGTAGPYAYAARRVGGRTVKEYLGSGLVADIEAERLEVRRKFRELMVVRLERLAGEEQLYARPFHQVERLYRRAMRQAGFHRIKRGPWRRRRPVESIEPPKAATTPLPWDGATDLFTRAQKGDQEAYREVLPLMDRDIEAFGSFDLTSVTSEAMLEAACGPNLVMREINRRKLARMTKLLAGDQPAPLEKLLAARIATCWLAVQWFEGAYARLDAKHDARLLEAHQRRIDRAHRRYLSAIKALADVRKLNVTQIQVNVGTNPTTTAPSQDPIHDDRDIPVRSLP